MEKRRIFQLKKRIFSMMLSMMLVISAVIFIPDNMPVVQAAVTFDGGDGSAVNPYRISNTNQFALITLGAAGKGKYYVLTNNINTASSQNSPLINGEFQGVFDGDGHYMALSQTLCATLGTSGVIKNLSFNCNISGDISAKRSYYVDGCPFSSALVGLHCGLLDNCVGTATINVTGNNLISLVGGFVGGCNGGTIRNCGLTSSNICVTNNGSSGFDIVGGFVAQTRGNTLIENSYFVGKVHGYTPSVNLFLGSILGHNTSGGYLTFKNSYAHNTMVNGEYSCANNSMGAIGRADARRDSFSNSYFRSTRDPNSEWPIGGMATGNIAGLTRVSSDPAAMYTANNATYRKMASATSFATYANNTAFGRSTLTLNANGGTTNSSLQKVIGTNLTLPSATRAGYTFKGWGSSANATTPIYTANAAYVSNTSGTLYALWTPNNYSVRFNANKPADAEYEVNGTMENEAFTYDVSQALSGNGFTLKNYTFNSWNTKPDGTGQRYVNSAAVKNLSDAADGVTELFAQWDFIWKIDNQTRESSALIEFDGNNPAAATLDNIPNKKKYTLELVGSSFTYDGAPHAPTFAKNVTESFTEATGVQVSELSYYAHASNFTNASAISLFDTRSGDEPAGSEWIDLDGEIPSEVGLYKAVASVGTYSIERVFSIVDGQANYSTLDISNKGADLQIQSHRMNPANPYDGSNLSSIKVHLSTEADSFTIYKVADISYNEADEIFNHPVWVDEVFQWIYDKGADYDTPTALGNAFASDMKVFYANLLTKSDSVINEPYNLEPYLPAYAEDTTFTYSGEPGAIDPTITVTGIEPGEYVIIAESPSQAFAPLVVNVLPQQSGATGSYYLMDIYEVSLKAAGANVTKLIVKGESDTALGEQSLENDPSDVHMDTVSISETRTFRLNIDMPNYKDRITLSSDGTAIAYKMSLTDIMDESMALLKKQDDVNLTSSIQLFYKDTDGSLKLLEYRDINYIEFTTNDYPGSSPVTDTIETTLNDCNYISRTAPMYTITEIASRASAEDPETMESGFTIDFNMAALKYWAKSKNLTAIPMIEVRYQTLVTDKVRVASELNVNTASITYEITDDGTATNTQSDLARIYTYGLTLHKLDGNTQQALAGATFNIYKRIGEFRTPSSGAPLTIDDGDSFKLSDESYSTLIPDGYTNLNDFASDSNFYVYTYNEAETGDNIDAIFIRLDFIGNSGALVSTVDDNGQNLTGDKFIGLSDGQYILSEVIAPVGYNKVAEDMLFTINRFTTDEVVANGTSSLAAYKDESGQAVASGYYDIVVYNYKGLTLPATGGIGTLLFTMVGLTLMGIVLAILIARRRRSDWELEYI